MSFLSFLFSLFEFFDFVVGEFAVALERLFEFGHDFVCVFGADEVQVAT